MISILFESPVEAFCPHTPVGTLRFPTPLSIGEDLYLHVGTLRTLRKPTPLSREADLYLHRSPWGHRDL